MMVQGKIARRFGSPPEKSPNEKEIYKEIRKERAEETLRTGEYWIVTVDGIPDRQMDSGTAYELSDWILKHATKDQIRRTRFKNVLSGDDFKVKELHLELKR